MTVLIPQVGHALTAKAAELANHKTLAAATNNPTLANASKDKVVQIQKEIVIALMNSGELPASAILSSMTFRAADTN